MTAAAGADAGGTPPIQVVLGPCDDMRAEVFVRVASSGTAITLTGSLSGPRCRRAITLPVTAPLVDQGGGLARAILTEPSFWTPELPNLYRLQVQMSDGERGAAICDRLVGLRRLGVKGRSFWLDGRRWVVRGTWCDAGSFAAATLREMAAAAMIADPPAGILTSADEVGVAILAVLRDTAGRVLDPGQTADRVAAWAAHPSVVAAILPEAMTCAEARDRAAEVRRLKGTMLLGWVVDGMRPPPEFPAGIDFLVVTLPRGGVPEEAWRSATPRVPLVAWRREADPGGSARSGCDALQAALAAWGLAAGVERLPWDWSGYLVS